MRGTETGRGGIWNFYFMTKSLRLIYLVIPLFFWIFRPRREKSPLDDLTNDSIDDHEEEFYYTEVELGAASSPPTLSHRDMARPPHEGKGCATNKMIIIRTIYSYFTRVLT